MEPCAEIRAPFEAIEVEKGVEQAVLDDVVRICSLPVRRRATLYIDLR